MTEKPPQACINIYQKYMQSCRVQRNQGKVNLDKFIIEIVRYRQTFVSEDGRDIIIGKGMITKIAKKCKV
jgi:hypothetical protein